MAGVFLFTSINVSYGLTVDKKVSLYANAFVDIDTDGDGLGDTWEIEHFGSIDLYDGDDDPDNDGYDNLWEYQHGTDPNNPDDPNYYISARNNALQFLKFMMDRRVDSGKRILHSYIDRNGNTEGYGWTYDNAVSVIAFEERGEWQRAKDVLDAFIWFQDRDPIGDGRIRRAYWANLPIDDLHVGDCSDWIPNTNSEAEDQSIGDMAIMILAALRYHEYMGEADSMYLSFAKRLGDWIYNSAKSDSGAGGYNMARKNNEMADPLNFDRKSTENNIDTYVAFMKLYEALNDHIYRLYALHAKNFVLSMWNGVDGMFWTGTLDDGVTINGGANSDVTGYDGVNPTSGQPEDTNTWGLLALGEKDKYGKGIDWVEGNCIVENIDGFTFGYDFNADRDGIWFEGMSHMALSYQMLGNDAKSDSILDVIKEAQDLGTGGIICASHDGVTTSFHWRLRDDLHISAAAWLIFAVDKYNPFWDQLVTDPIPYEGGYNEDGDQYILNEPWAEASVINIAPATDGTTRAMADLAGEGGDDKGTLTLDDDGEIVKYEWDFDGKGTFDWSSTTTGNVTYWYTDVGTHLAKFRVTNDRGYTSTKGVTINITQSDLGGGVTPPVVSNVSTSVINGTAPLTVTFTGSGSDSDGYVAGYQWDFNGDGEYDSYSETSGNVTYIYREAGSYEPTLKITDNDGLTDTASLAIEVLENQAGPKAQASANRVADKMPHLVTFYATGSSGDINTYEWDFEGDSTYDWLSESSGTATYTYGEPGTYEAKLRVTDANGVSDTDTVKIRVEYDATLNIPEAIGSALPLRGIVPYDIIFTHSSSIGTIVKYEWDFDGNKDYEKAALSPDDVTHTYTRPGYYLATLKVTDEDSLTHRAYLPIVATGPDQVGAVYASYIKTPQSGQRIYGNSVTVSIELIPNNRNQNAQLQYKSNTAGDDAWADVDSSISYPYRTTIDATAIPQGDYDFRGPVNNIADKAKIALIIIDSVNWDIYEEINGNGERIKKVKIDKDVDTIVELVDGTGAEIKAGTLDANDILTIKVPNSSGTFVDGGTNTVLYQREFILSSATSLNKPITIIIPYDDKDNDGIVDGLGIPEAELILYVYNEVTKEWEPLVNYIIYTDDNYVSGEVTHLSIFGLGGSGDNGGAGITSSGSGSSGSSGGGGGGRSCFIATATFGTSMANEVQSLRFFRDNYLLTNRPGEFIIDLYERYSPPIARIIEGSEFLKGMVRFYLRPVITFSRWANVIKGADCHD